MSWNQRDLPNGFDPIAAGPDLVWANEDRILAGWGVLHRIDVSTGAHRAADALAQLAEVVAPGAWKAFFSFTFDRDRTGSVLIVPEMIVEGDGVHRRLIHHQDVDALPDVAPEFEVDRPRYAGSSLPDLLWLDAVAEAISVIRGGSAEKIVLARDLAVWSEKPFDTRRLVRRLRTRFPECFTYLVDGLVGSFPELIARRTGSKVESIAVAGSAPRSDDPQQDRELGEDLLNSEKDIHEHLLAADSVAAVLELLCSDLDRSHRSLLQLDNIHHLQTSFSGTLREPVHLLELADKIHPSAAVGGTPTDVALAEIIRLEKMDRARYAGPVGWFDEDGDGEAAIALRCAQISGARARLFAGTGIVSGSLPEDELEETRVKLQAMMGALEY
ncbi:MAG: isochorismate synthase [Acidimicrobiia bacterium]|nr:isochorismate synthase [Acidimicrobiia bacterium]